MKFLFFSVFGLAALIGPANAADVPLKAPLRGKPATNVWSGFYLGIQGGLNWSTSQVFQNDPTIPATDGFANTNSFRASGVLIGGTVGYNWQIQNWVAGLEGDLSFGSLRGSGNGIAPFNTAFINTVRSKWLATARARVGTTVADNVLVYATAGLAAAGITYTVDTAAAALGIYSQTTTAWGGAFGGGLEYALNSNWSVKAEYIYVALPSKTFFSPNVLLPDGTTLVTRKVSFNENVLRAGVNYRF